MTEQGRVRPWTEAAVEARPTDKAGVERPKVVSGAPIDRSTLVVMPARRASDGDSERPPVVSRASVISGDERLTADRVAWTGASR